MTRVSLLTILTDFLVFKRGWLMIRKKEGEERGKEAGFIPVGFPGYQTHRAPTAARYPYSSDIRRLD